MSLARTPDRNLIRNSGQYWKATGLLEDVVGEIRLTPLGRGIADRDVTKIEFATTVVKTLELPNPGTSNRDRWEAAGLVIKPLELILDIMAGLFAAGGKDQAYLTPQELIKIVIPLAGISAPVNRHVDSLIQHRQGRLSVSSWPDVTPSANDKRMAREFLLFLGNYGLCRVKHGLGDNMHEKYFLGALVPKDAKRLVELPIQTTPMRTLESVRESGIPAFAERRKVMMEIRTRPHQARFRRNVLVAYSHTCILTGEDLSEVLEAAHIKPDGRDAVENAFCFRADVHTLFDAGHLQIDPQGTVKLSSLASQSRSYSSLPSRVTIPSFVDRANLEWRWLYY